MLRGRPWQQTWPHATCPTHQCLQQTREQCPFLHAGHKKEPLTQSHGIEQYFKRFPGCKAARRGFAAPRMNGGNTPDLESLRDGSDIESDAAGTPRAPFHDEVRLDLNSLLVLPPTRCLLHCL